MIIRKYKKQIALLLLICYCTLSVVMAGLAAQHSFMQHGKKHDHASQHFSISCHWLCTAAVGVTSVTSPLIGTFYYTDDYTAVFTQLQTSQFSVYLINNRSPPSSIII